MDLSRTKNIFFKTLIGCLIAAATLAVVTVLIGKFNDVSQKALFTILLIAIHSLVSLSFIENNEKQHTFDSLTFFTNVTFGIIILSFATSVLGTWGVIAGSVVAKSYAFYFVLLFAALHAEVLAKTVGKQRNIDNVVFANYLFMTVVVVMLLPVIFAPTDATYLSGFYYRLLAACGIIDATLTLIAVILHSLYVQKHPKVVDPVFGVQVQLVPGHSTPYVQTAAPASPPKKHMNGFVLVLIVFVALQALSGIIVAFLGTIHR